MKSITMNSNSIFSKIKEDLKNILSFSNADKFTTESEEISLPKVYKDSLEKFAIIAKNYEENGTLSCNSKSENTYTQKTIANKNFGKNSVQSYNSKSVNTSNSRVKGSISHTIQSEHNSKQNNIQTIEQDIGR